MALTRRPARSLYVGLVTKMTEKQRDRIEKLEREIMALKQQVQQLTAQVQRLTNPPIGQHSAPEDIPGRLGRGMGMGRPPFMR